MDELIRTIEQTVLDNHHRGQPLLSRPRDLAVGHLLKLHAHFHRDLGTVDRDILTLKTTMQTVHRGLTQAIRWVLLNDSETRETVYDWRQLDEDALALLTWAGHYMVLATSHVAWSREVLSCAIDPVQRRIRFVVPPGVDMRFFFGQQNSDILWMKDFFASIPHYDLACIYVDWMRLATRDETGMNVEPELVLQSHKLRRLVNWAYAQTISELSDEYFLDGYRVGDWCTFYAVLFAHSYCINKFEDACDVSIGRDNPIGSSCFSLPRDELEEWFCRATGLEHEIVHAITGDLMFDSRSESSSLTCNPIIALHSGTLMLSPRLFTALHPMRMLAGSLLRGPRRRVYDSLIETVERVSISNIASQFQTAGFDTSRPRLKQDAGDPLTPDLLVCGPDRKQVVILEYKHALPPCEPATVANRLRDVTVWMERLRQYVCAFRADGNYARSLGIDPEAVRILPILLFRFPMPIPLAVVDDIAISDWCSLSRFFPLPQGFELVDMWNWARLRPDAEAIALSAQTIDEDIVVGEWTYTHQVFATPTAKN